MLLTFPPRAMGLDSLVNTTTILSSKNRCLMIGWNSVRRLSLNSKSTCSTQLTWISSITKMARYFGFSRRIFRKASQALLLLGLILEWSMPLFAGTLKTSWCTQLTTCTTAMLRSGTVCLSGTPISLRSSWSRSYSVWRRTSLTSSTTWPLWCHPPFSRKMGSMSIGWSSAQASLL